MDAHDGGRGAGAGLCDARLLLFIHERGISKPLRRSQKAQVATTVPGKRCLDSIGGFSVMLA